MFSALKRFTSKHETSLSSNGDSAKPPPGHQSMSSSLQKKFARGVQYNMKIIIKGDRNVGKTCLFYRLQGKKFVEEYIPTDEIQVASIHWNYKAADDVVKVEVWDVVDKGKKKRHFDGLKLDNAQIEIPEEAALDAEFLDVYKGTNGVIMMMDLTKSWTFDYVQRELPKVPAYIPVIILANHCDMSHHRTVTADHVTYYIDSLKRNAQVRYAEASMRNGFGLKLLHKFFNLPFLQLQRESLLRQLERNEEETNAMVQELDMYFDTDEADYGKFLDNLVKRRREMADSNSNIQPVAAAAAAASGSFHNSTSIDSSVNNRNAPDSIKRSQSGPIVIGAGKPIPFTNYNQTVDKTGQLQSSRSQTYSRKSSSSGFVSKPDANNAHADLKRLDVNSGITSVEDFCPDDGLDRNFLEDGPLHSENVSKIDNNMESDSDNETGNPLVSEFQDDFESDEEIGSSANNVNAKREHSELLGTRDLTVNTGSEIETDKVLPKEADNKQNDDFDVTINSEISEITSEDFDAWMGSDTKWRRSPEGGEDVSAANQTFDFSGSTMYDDSASITSSNVHSELLSSKYSSVNSRNDMLNSDGDEAALSNGDRKQKKDKCKYERKKQHKKTKEKSKEKSEKTKRKDEKRAKERNPSRRDELEEFLNGAGGNLVDSAYEAI